MKPEMLKKAKMSAKTSDWLQGYGYQMWRCATTLPCDGANGQYILVLPDKDAVIAVTAQHPRHAGRAESNMEVPAARAIKRLFL